MIGITAHAVSIPRYRIERVKIASPFGVRALKGERSAINFDEDSLTMATSAVQLLLPMVSCDGLYFASTTPPYGERLNASLMAAACDLSEDVTVADFANSLRAGTIAMGAALESVAASARRHIVVAAADVREAEPESPEEQLFGDAAAAVAVGRDGVIAELKARASVYDDFLDTVRRDKDQRVTSFASKFTFERGYQDNVLKVILKILEQSHLSPTEMSKLILPPVDSMSHMKVATQAGFQPGQVQDTFFERLGVTGCSMSLLLLSAALEKAKPGDKILLVGYGDGADAMLFETTELIGAYKVARSIETQLSDPLHFHSYEMFRKARDYFRQFDDGPEISNSFYQKEAPQVIRLHGTQCHKCGTRQYPCTRVCIVCKNTKSLKEVRLEKQGRVFTYTTDSLFSSPMPPTVVTVVDLIGGGRIYVQMTDVRPEEVRIDMPVELMLRRMNEGGGLHHYYWKCRPREA